jgi:hypothetical protein
MEHAFGLLDAGKYEDALAAFQIVLQSGDPLAQRALLGMAELFEKLGDNETRLSMAKGAFEFDDRTLKLAMVQLHYLPLMWPRDEEVSQDPNLAGRMRAELVVHAASFLPEDNPESDLDHEVAIFVSNAANQVLFHFDSRVVEAQLHASFILAVDSADLKTQYRAMRNIHSFFSGILPSEVSAILVINKVSTSWSHFNNVIGQLDRCEQDLQTLIGRSLSDDELAAIAAEFDRLMEAPDYNFYNAYFSFGMLVDYLQSPQVNRQSLLVQVLIEKYLS